MQNFPIGGGEEMRFKGPYCSGPQGLGSPSQRMVIVQTTYQPQVVSGVLYSFVSVSRLWALSRMFNHVLEKKNSEF